ncbi:MAG: hypothetical protein NZN28_06965 [Meiothermus sp.]|uniref:hypothetical protein n=1 Tax=Meiothermus sp. TaxID=1955249 RepID=UPI0025E11624|nr:hypothetical protein [Meiothermus sp.]MCS7068353.1 hypothetical protein [Meiothermus sp.]
MKRLVPLVFLFAVMFGSLGKAQSDGFGLYSGFPTWIGVQYQVSNLRVGGGLAFAGLGAGADYMILEQAIPAAPGFTLSWYAGAGVSAGFWTVLGNSGIYIFPHGLAGIEYAFPGQPFSVYGEGQIGFGIGTGALSGVLGGFDYNIRAGLIFRP